MRTRSRGNTFKNAREAAPTAKTAVGRLLLPGGGLLGHSRLFAPRRIDRLERSASPDRTVFGSNDRRCKQVSANLLDPSFVPRIRHVGFESQHFHLAGVLRVVVGRQFDPIGGKRPTTNSAQNRGRVVASC